MGSRFTLWLKILFIAYGVNFRKRLNRRLLKITLSIDRIKEKKSIILSNVEFIKSDFTHCNTKLYFRQKLNCAEYAKIAARIYDVKNM